MREYEYYTFDGNSSSSTVCNVSAFCEKTENIFSHCTATSRNMKYGRELVEETLQSDNFINMFVFPD